MTIKGDLFNKDHHAYPDSSTRKKCGTLDACREVGINQARVLGIKTAKCSHTIRNWYQEFWKERNIKVKILPGKHNMPPFLQQNQDVTIKQYYLCKHLHELSVDLLCEYIHDTVLPKMIKESTGAVPTDDQYINDVKLLFGKYGLQTISVSAVCNMKSGKKD